MNDLLSTCAVALAAGAAAGGWRWATLRRVPVGHRHPLWRRDIAAFGFATTLVLLVFGAGRLALHERAGVVETIDRGEIVLWALGLFALTFLPYRAFFGALYRDADWDFRYGFLLSRFVPAMLFAGSLLAMDAANRHGDRGFAVDESMTVASPPRASGPGCVVHVQAADGGRIAVPADGTACKRLAPGVAITVPVRPGLFGARWVGTQDVAALSGP